MSVEELTREGMALSADQRTLLAHRLLDGIEEFVEADLEAEWMAEADGRWAEIESRDVKCPRTTTRR
jgi:hypothetical protein